jgi:hypothetical protein
LISDAFTSDSSEGRRYSLAFSVSAEFSVA